MYPEHLVLPMKAELTEKGFTDLRTIAEVDDFLAKKGTTLVVVNSVCGCAAGNARPGAKLAVEHSPKTPTQVGTVFAGFDTEATNHARSYMAPHPPSSPSMALFKDGELVFFLPRHSIEGSTAQIIAGELAAAFDEHCDD